jgi:hypothetical protein
MAYAPQTTLDKHSLKVLVDSIDLTRYVVSGDISWEMDDLCRSMNLSFCYTEDYDFPSVRRSSAVKIYLSNKIVFNGWVDKLTANPTRSGFTLDISGRSKTADFVDATVGRSIEIKGSRSLSSILKLVAPQVKALGLKIVSKVNPALTTTVTDEQFNALPTTNLFEFLAGGFELSDARRLLGSSFQVFNFGLHMLYFTSN